MRSRPGCSAGPRRVRVIAATVVTSAVLGGCGDTGPPDEVHGSEALINGGGPVLDGAVIDGRVNAPVEGSSYVARTCGLVLDWTYEIVAVVNSFTEVSREDSPAERRVDYLESFDAALALADELAAGLEGTARPDGVDAGALHDAVSRGRDELEDAQRQAEDLPADAFEVRRVRSGRLFVASEKARSVVFGGLDAMATGNGLTTLLAPCGRPQYPEVVEPG